MKGKPSVIKALNGLLTGELSSADQYFIHSRMYHDWGLGELYERVKHEMEEELQHAARLIERILFLEGVPNVQRLGRISIGESVPEQFKLDLALEHDAVKRLGKAIAICFEAADHGSRELLETILRSEEEHLGWLETQLDVIKQIGDARYLAEQLRKPS